MGHRSKIDRFWSNRTKIDDPVVSTHFKVDGSHDIDFEFIRQFVASGSRVLDLGAGSCVVAQRLAGVVDQVVAVDKFGSFLQMAEKHPNLILHESDILDYEADEKFDLCLLFGVMNYFDEEESQKIYSKIEDILDDNGVLLIKHQCGVDDDVVVDRFSENLNTEYFAFYRAWAKEKSLLDKYFDNVEVIDIYPRALNVWENTHFYAFACRKSSGRR